MKKKIATAWVKALRGSDYEFGAKHCMRENFEDGYRYDPLGVLCDLAVQAKKARWKLASPDMVGVWWVDGECPFWPSDGVVEWAGISDMDYLEDTVMEAYDNGTPVKRVADFIEENFEQL